MSNNGTIIFIIPNKANQITILPPENYELLSIGLINVHLKSPRILPLYLFMVR